MVDYVGMRLTLGIGSQRPTIKFMVVSATSKQAAKKQIQNAFQTSSAARTSNKKIINVKTISEFVRSSWNGLQPGMTDYGTNGINPFSGQDPWGMKHDRFYDGDPYEYCVSWYKLKPLAKKAATTMIIKELNEKIGKEVAF